MKNKGGTQRLLKQEVLRKDREIKQLFAKGKRFRYGNLAIIYLPAERQRAGFIASRKVGGAFKRNRVKRILREAYRMHKAIFKGLEVILYADGLVDRPGIERSFTAFKEGR